MRADDARIVDELVTLAQEPSGEWLLQFRGLVGARQYRHLYRLLRSVAPPGSRVLDWGVANGHFSYFLQRAGYETFGYSLEDLTFDPLLGDPSYGFVRGGPSQVVELPFRTGSFDVVVSVGVLEHVREVGGDEAASLREIHRILRPGGAFVAYHFPRRRSWVEFLARRTPGKPQHEYLYSRREIAELAGAADLQLEEVRRYAFLPRNLWSKAPSFARNSRLVAATWDALDTLLASLLAPLCTYYWFVARKPE